ncbi:MAG: hypothetical protein R3E08_14210 [Thiotrichaceae bacterium]
MSRQLHSSITEPTWIRYLLIGTTLIFLCIFLVLPLIVVFIEALRGWSDNLFCSID